jgi:transcriptional regulator with XRE-family HTH domain
MQIGMKMTSQNKQLFLANLQRNMQERGWSVSKMARETGIHQSQVSRIAAGDFKTFGSNIIKICMEFDMEPVKYYSVTREEEDRKQIANAAISIWDGTRRDAAVVVSLLHEIAKLRKHGVRR